MGNIVFIVATPLALLNAQEAIHYYSHEQPILLVDRIGEREKGVLQRELWGRIIELGESHNVFLKLFSILKVKLKLRKIDTLYMTYNDTSYSRLYVLTLKYKKLVYFDDGVATLGLQDPESRFRQTLMQRMIPQSGWKFSLFTAFKLKCFNGGGELVTNNYDLIKSHAVSEKKVINELHFFGQPLVELGFVSQENYEFSIRKVIETLGADLKFRYIPHHHEELSRVQVMCEGLGVDLWELKSIPEVCYITGEEVPAYVVSFISTLLFTLPNMLESCMKYVAVDVSDIFIDPVEKPRFVTLFKQLKYQGQVKVIKIKNG